MSGKYFEGPCVHGLGMQEGCVLCALATSDEALRFQVGETVANRIRSVSNEVEDLKARLAKVVADQDAAKDDGAAERDGAAQANAEACIRAAEEGSARIKPSKEDLAQAFGEVMSRHRTKLEGSEIEKDLGIAGQRRSRLKARIAGNIAPALVPGGAANGHTYERLARDACQLAETILLESGL